jgi:hypothetical protein
MVCVVVESVREQLAVLV